MSAVGEAAQLRISPLKCCWRGTALSGWRGCPAPPVSPASSRSQSTLSGWRGCPTPAVSPVKALSRVRNVSRPNCRRYLPAQVAVGEVRCQVGEAAQLRGISPLKRCWSGTRCQVGEVAQLRRCSRRCLRGSEMSGWRGRPTRPYLPVVVVGEVQRCQVVRGCPAPPVSPRSRRCRGSEPQAASAAVRASARTKLNRVTNIRCCRRQPVVRVRVIFLAPDPRLRWGGRGPAGPIANRFTRVS